MNKVTRSLHADIPHIIVFPFVILLANFAFRNEFPDHKETIDAWCAILAFLVPALGIGIMGIVNRIVPDSDIKSSDELKELERKINRATYTDYSIGNNRKMVKVKDGFRYHKVGDNVQFDSVDTQHNFQIGETISHMEADGWNLYEIVNVTSGVYYSGTTDYDGYKYALTKLIGFLPKDNISLPKEFKYSRRIEQVLFVCSRHEYIEKGTWSDRKISINEAKSSRENMIIRGYDDNNKLIISAVLNHNDQRKWFKRIGIES